jgi:DNA ligase (NAD+)
VGAQAAQLLARHFGSLEALMAATPEQLGAVRGIGTIIAESVAAHFADPSAQALLTRLAARGLTLVEPDAVEAHGALNGQTVVLTGTLPTLSRDEATALVEQAGGRVTSSVSRKTSFVVAGEEAGSKLDKAKTLGVPVVDEAGLRARLAGGAS